MIPRLRLLYRADGGHRIGTGHVLRAVRVLRELKRHVELEAALAVSNDPSGLSYAAEAEVPLIVLPPSMYGGVKPVFEPDVLLKHVSLDEYDAIVVDMLDTPAGSLGVLSGPSRAVITMDDRGPGRYDADAIINFLVREPDPRSLPSHSQLYEGPEYVTLDPSYAEPCRRDRSKPSEGARVLVTLGGADAAGLSLKVARALKRVAGIGAVEFICGKAYRHEPALRDTVRDAPWGYAIRHAMASLRDAFLRSDLAVVAGGMTMHEACCTGTPAVAVCQPIDHQLELAEWFQKEGAMVSVGDGTVATEEDIAEAVAELLQDKAKRVRMSHVGPKLVDGQGTRRTAEAILKVASAKTGR